MTVWINSVCSVGETCPEVGRDREGWLRVHGYQLDQRGQRLPGEPEIDVEVPDELLTDTAAQVVDNLGEFIAERHRADALRVQTLDRYAVASDDRDYERYNAGLPFALTASRAAWGDRIEAWRREGKVRRNLHVIHEPLSDYLRYQFEWGYAYLAARGMDLRILPVANTPAADQLFHVGDFTVIEHLHVVRSRYDADGAYLGAVQVPAAGAHGYAALAELAWEQAVPFAAWWANHPHYHRPQRAA